jgi:hypothetical protein
MMVCKFELVALAVLSFDEQGNLSPALTKQFLRRD